ncbi:MAG: hypothetical protein M1587_05025 [Thaumarchaeota archaeon]|nr:hypothetical protein [Nitrososphaerota archaeon]
MNKKAKTRAILLVVVIVPSLMFGLGVLGFLLARSAGLGDASIWIALVLSTIGFAISVLLTLRIGKSFEKTENGIQA